MTNFLEEKCRESYERARLGQAMIGLWPVPLMVCAGLLLGGHHRTMIFSSGIGLAVVGLYVLWRGQSAARAWWPGLLAGSVTLALPALVHFVQRLCTTCDMGPGSLFCIGVCVAGGSLAGVVVGMRSRLMDKTWEYLGAVTLVSGLSALLGCGIAGYAGIVGLLGGMAVGAIPFLIVGAKETLP